METLVDTSHMHFWHKLRLVFARNPPPSERDLSGYLERSKQTQPLSPGSDTMASQPDHKDELMKTWRMLQKWPVYFIFFALFSLVIGIFPIQWLSTEIPWRLLSFLLWCVSTGMLGSLAYVSVNILSIQKDATFSIEEHRLVHIRVVLGTLFAVILSIPFGWDKFVRFSVIAAQVTGQEQAQTKELVGLGIYLVMPFVLGFSTPVALTILGRFASAIDAFFGGVTAGTTTAVEKARKEADEKNKKEAEEKAKKLADEKAAEAAAKAKLLVNVPH